MDLPVITMTSIPLSDNIDSTDRKIQQSLFEEEVMFLQDKELIDFIKVNSVDTALVLGDAAGYFLNFVQQAYKLPVKYCIIIINKPFNFNCLIKDVNFLLEHALTKNGIVYLSVNKYQAQPMEYNTTLPANYDDAIGVYFNKNIIGTIEQYHRCGEDGGNKFNWVHPLTRFYIRNNIK